MDNLYGLIGYPLTHSFSEKYFRNKFKKENLSGYDYQLFALEAIEKIEHLIATKANLRGLNVTIPYKEVVIPFLTQLDASAQRVGAVNVIKLSGRERIGYNSDYYAFQATLLAWLPTDVSSLKALILGTGGAAKAVMAALDNSGISFHVASRQASPHTITYNELNSSTIIGDCKLIINTTPLGMMPNIETFPDLPYEQITSDHCIYDLIYNPEKTIFLKKAAAKGATIKNGLEMLQLQAEKSWEIWTS